DDVGVGLWSGVWMLNGRPAPRDAPRPPLIEVIIELPSIVQRDKACLAPRTFAVEPVLYNRVLQPGELVEISGRFPNQRVAVKPECRPNPELPVGGPLKATLFVFVQGPVHDELGDKDHDVIRIVTPCLLLPGEEVLPDAKAGDTEVEHFPFLWGG